MNKAGIGLHHLATWWDVLSLAEDGSYFPAEAIAGGREFLDDPTGWSADHGGKGA